jgi:hypothetical protein
MKYLKIAKAGNVIGEYDVSTIRRYLADGSISPTDYGWTTGMTEWKQLHELGFMGIPPPIPQVATSSALHSQTIVAPKKRPFAYSAWMVAAFFAPYLFSWRIIFDKTLGYSRGWKIFYSLWILAVLGMTSGSGRGPTENSEEAVKRKNDAFYRSLTPEQKIAMDTFKSNIRAAIRQDFDVLDANDDGRLDRIEFVSEGALAGRRKESDFDRYDLNKDGYVTFEEMTSK